MGDSQIEPAHLQRKHDCRKGTGRRNSTSSFKNAQRIVRFLK